MDQALKQRLVGATVLIALGVIFLPIFIGGSSDEQVNIQNDEFLIPPQPQVSGNNGEPGRRLPLVSPSPVTSNSDNDAAVDLSSGEIRLPLPEESLPPATTDDDLDLDGGLSQSAPASIEQNDAIPVEPVAQSDPAPSEPVLGEAQTDSADSSAAAPVPVTVPPVSSASTQLEQSWRVQVASLGNPDNATRLINQIEALGFPAQREIITRGGVSLNRVTAGPFASEAEASAANAAIRQADSRLNPQVLSPDNGAAGNDAADSAAAVAQPGGLDRYAVQAGVFSSDENASKLVERLNNAGYAAYSERVQGSDKTLFRVRIGPLLSASDAENIAARIQRDLSIRGLVVDY